MKVKRSQLIKEAEKKDISVDHYISCLVREDNTLEIEDDTRDL